MPSKRQAPIESDVEENSGASLVSKRARTAEDSDEELTSTQPTSPRSTKARGKVRQTDDDLQLGGEESEDDIGPMVPNEDEERRFEEENEQSIRERIANRGKVQGGIAEMGIIERLEMHNFMCHKYLTFNFGPQINFIIGHNGSGKSAVLSALTVALGGKATTTGRGNGLKAFIREGQRSAAQSGVQVAVPSDKPSLPFSVAEVTVTIKNQGDEAYKHNDYGDSIVITRKFTKEGSSGYKIKSKEGKVLSTKREDLSAICDHMNIQIDNPMTILTQDAARQFLSASQPTEKYKFFLRGTQLSQLSEEYSICLQNTTHAAKILVHKSSAIKDLQDALDEAKVRLKEAQKAREQQHKVDALRKELAWAYVAEKEQELSKKFEIQAKQQRQIAKAQKELEKAESDCEDASKQVEEHEKRLQELGEMKHLEEQKRKVMNAIRENKSKLSDLKNDTQQMNLSIQNVNNAIDQMKARVGEEQQKAEASTQGKRDSINQRLVKAQEDLQAAEGSLDSIRSQAAGIRAESEGFKSKGPALEKEVKALQENIRGIEHSLASCDEREKDKLAPYGRNMDKVLDAINQATWRGQKPIGPLGMYVSLKDKGKWAELLRSQLGNLMTSFAVTDARDRKALSDILKSHGNGNVTIAIAAVDLFDYSKGEPPPDYLTVLRVLQFSNPFVLRIFINQANIERVLLAKTRREGDDRLVALGRGGVCWTADFYKVQRYPEGGAHSSLLYALSRSDSRSHLFTETGVEDDRREYQSELNKLRPLLAQKTRELHEMRAQFSKVTETAADLESRQARALQEVRKLGSRRDEIQDELKDELPVNIQALYDELKQREEEKESILKQFAELLQQKNKLDELQKPFDEELQQIRSEIDKFGERRAEITGRIETAIALRLTAQSHQKHYASKLADAQVKLDAAEAVANRTRTEFENWTTTAQQFCERVNNPRKPEVVKRQVESIEKALEEREKRQGASVDDMANEVNKKKLALENARKEVKDMANLNKALKHSIRIRLARWHEFRRHIALRCKTYFSYHLAKRGYYGKVIFDHVVGTLLLKVQTEDQTATQGGSREKDPRSLSGGEKSFSTICLLLSLWESIGCPIRCLDEFDVFMDAVNRRISMKMMIDTANASDRKQYILITPQDMTNIHIGNTVRVHRMIDPERGQGVLAFQ